MTDSGYIDYTTGLYNRKWLFEQFGKEIKSGTVTVLYMDLDNFKTVNDLYGHDEGDRVLDFFSDAIRHTDPEGYPVRMSGDEFVLILDRPVVREDISGVYGRIVDCIKKGINEVPSLSLISVSAGAQISHDAGDLQDILKNADDAMYQAKRDGKGRCVFYEDIMERILKEKTISEGTPKALKEGRFSVMLDPMINLQNSLPEQTRAAVVFTESDGSIKDTEEFRYVLEENGFIRTLDLSLFNSLLETVSKMDRSLIGKCISKSRNIRLSFEMSHLLIIDKGFCRDLQKSMLKYGVDPGLIDISVSEKTFAGREAEPLISGMKELKGLGVTLTIKDFGDNFGSIRYLASIPVSTVRFDSSWLKKALRDEREKKILKSVIRMVKDLHLTAIATGVSDREGLEYLKGFGCDAVGGHSVFEFMTPGDYFDFIREKLPDSDGIFFDFNGGLKDTSGRFEGRIVGENISLAEGISSLHGALHFGGGDIGKNLVELPAKLFPSTSYTVSFWMKPEKNNNWCSAIYMRYQGGFSSLVPYSNAENGISVFRVSIDNDDFYDTTCRSVRKGEWNHMCVAYDASNETVRYFINGRKARVGTGIPVQIGCRKVLLGGDPFQKSFEGSVSALCIYDYAVTDEAVKLLYNSYKNEPGYSGTVEEYWMDTE